MPTAVNPARTKAAAEAKSHAFGSTSRSSCNRWNAREPSTSANACACPGHACRPAPNHASRRSTSTTDPSGATRRVTGTGGSTPAINALVAPLACTSTPIRFAVSSSHAPPHATTSRPTAASAAAVAATCGW